MLFIHDILKSDAYHAYAAQVSDRVNTVRSPMNIQLQQVMPQLHSKMDLMSVVLDTGMEDLQYILRTTVDENHQRLHQQLMPTLFEVGTCGLQPVLICQRTSDAVDKGYAHVGIECNRLTFQCRPLNEESRVASPEGVLRLKVVCELNVNQRVK